MRDTSNRRRAAKPSRALPGQPALKDRLTDQHPGLVVEPVGLAPDLDIGQAAATAHGLVTVQQAADLLHIPTRWLAIQANDQRTYGEGGYRQRPFPSRRARLDRHRPLYLFEDVAAWVEQNRDRLHRSKAWREFTNAPRDQGS
jgi:hypothetical protein